jgi:hypothetical protein
MLQLKKYSRWKINIRSIFGQHKIPYQEIKKKIDFRNTLNHFIFEKLFIATLVLNFIKILLELKRQRYCGRKTAIRRPLTKSIT